MTITPTARTTPGASEGAPTSPGSTGPEAARRRRPGPILSLLIVGLVLAAAAIVWSDSDEPVPAQASPTSADGTEHWLTSLDGSASPTSADGTERWLTSLDGSAGPASADGAERRAAAEQDALHTRCAGSSADAVERCIISG
jgi:hypothetical protein